MSTLLLSQKDLHDAVGHVGISRFMDLLIERLTEALAGYDSNRTEIPIRAGFHYERPVTGLIEWMPLLAKQESVLMKIVGYHPESPDKLSMPTILSNLSKYDPLTGRLLALLDGTFLTAMRTGAASAIASRILARPDSRALGLIGCGAQAVTQLHALSRVFPLSEVLIFDADESAMSSFASRVAVFTGTGLDIRSAQIDEVVAGSDILCVATSVGIGEGPVFKQDQVRPWLHVNAVGSDFPGKVELPQPLLLKSYVCPDVPDQARREGECQQLLPDQIGCDLVTIVKHSERFLTRQQGNTVFDSTGWALEDQVAMELLLEFAEQLGLGSQVQIEHLSKDPRDPYEFLNEATSNGEVVSTVRIGGGA